MRKNIVLNQNEKGGISGGEVPIAQKESEWTGRSCLRWSILQALVEWSPQIGL